MSLKQQVVKGVSWNFIEQIIRQVMSVGVTAVLARMLSPNDYGLVALSSIFIGFLSMFGDLSIGSALIQKNNLEDHEISTSFWICVFTGLTLAIILCAIAPFAAQYYDQPLLSYIIIISALSFVITPIYSTHKILLTKKLQFNKMAQLNILLAGFAAVASLILAISGYGVWSLVLGDLIATIMLIPIVWHFEKWRPKFIFDRACFKSLFSFSSYLLSSNVLFYFARNFDNLIVGKYLGANVLGIYSMAYKLMMKPLQQISWSVTTVLFPAFSTIQDDIGRIRSGYLKVIKGIALITFPMMFGLMIVSREFILVMVGPKWEGVIQPLQVLCLVGAIQSVGTTFGSIFISLGRADLQFKTGVVNSVGHIIGFIICIRWGLMGLVKGYLVTSTIFFCSTCYVMMRLINLPLKHFVTSMNMSVVNTIIMVLALMGFRHLDTNFMKLNIYLNLTISILLGVLVYIGSTLLFMGRDERNELSAMVFKNRKPVSIS